MRFLGQDRKRIILGRTMASERRTSGKNFFFERKKVKKSQVRGFTGARLGGVPFGRHFRFGGSQS